MKVEIDFLVCTGIHLVEIKQNATLILFGVVIKVK
jgi:hypothetical protein